MSDNDAPIETTQNTNENDTMETNTTSQTTTKNDESTHTNPYVDDDTLKLLQSVDRETLMSKTRSSLLRRGQKFSHTILDKEKLATAHQMMYNAMTHPRRKNLDQISEGIFFPEEGRVRIVRQRTKHFEKLGSWEKGVCWLQPEEALFLVERGMLHLWKFENLPSKEAEPTDDNMDTSGESSGPTQGESYASFLGLNRQTTSKTKPESEESKKFKQASIRLPTVQDAFHLFMCTRHPTTNRLYLTWKSYFVFKYLKQMGFQPLRHSPSHFPQVKPELVEKKIQHTERVLCNVTLRSDPLQRFETKRSKERRKSGSNVLKTIGDIDSLNKKHRYWWKKEVRISQSEIDAPSSTYYDPRIDKIDRQYDYLNSNPDNDSLWQRDSVLSSLKEGDEIPFVHAHQVLQIVEHENFNVEEIDIPEKWQIQYDVWRTENWSRRKHDAPLFAVLITDFRDPFPDVETIFKLEMTCAPTPVNIAVVENGQITFVNLNSTFEIPTVSDGGRTFNMPKDSSMDPSD